MADKTVDQHYNDVSEDYDRFMRWRNHFIDDVGGFIQHLIQLANVTADDRVVEMAAGSAVTLRQVKDLTQSSREYIAVDPCPVFMEKVSKMHTDFTTYCMDAEQFSSLNIRYDVMIIRASIHNFPEGMAALFRNFAKQMESGGRLLITNCSLEVFPGIEEEGLPFTLPTEDIVSALESCAGLSVQKATLKYDFKLPAEEYKAMLRGRWMSMLRGYSDGELEKLVARLKETADGCVQFEFEFDLIMARKDSCE